MIEDSVNYEIERLSELLDKIEKKEITHGNNREKIDQKCFLLEFCKYFINFGY